MNHIQNYLVRNNRIILKSLQNQWYSVVKPLTKRYIKDILFSHDYKKILLQVNDEQWRKYILKYEKIWQFNDNLEQNNKIALQIVQTDDFYVLSYYLSVLHNATKWGQKHIISAQLYMALLTKYYSLLGIDNPKKPQNLKKISQTININYLVTNFIYLQNQQILSMLKINQIKLFQRLIESKDISIDEFMMIINRQLYNVTDLPLIHQIIYKHYIPKIINLDDICKYKECIQYLYRFQCLEHFLFQKILQLIQHTSKKQIIEIQCFITTLELISVYFFKNNDFLSKPKASKPLQLTIKHILQKSIKINDSIKPIQQLLIQQQNWSYLIQPYKNLNNKQISKILQQKHYHINNPSNKDDNKFNFINLIFKSKKDQLQKLNQEDIKQSLFKINKTRIYCSMIEFISIAAYFKYVHIDSYGKVLTSRLILQFIKDNMYAVDFMKDLVKVHQRIAIQHQALIKAQLKYTFDQIDKQYSHFRTTVTHFIEKDIVNLSNQIYNDHQSNQSSSYFPYFYPLQLHQLKPSTKMIDIMMHCLNQKHNTNSSHKKMIKMLKEDPPFLSTTIQYNGRQLLSNYIKNNLLFTNYNLNKWNYPYFYDCIQNNNHYSIINNFNKNQMMPLNLIKYKNRIITNYITLCKAISNKKEE